MFAKIITGTKKDQPVLDSAYTVIWYRLSTEGVVTENGIPYAVVRETSTLDAGTSNLLFFTKQGLEMTSRAVVTATPKPTNSIEETMFNKKVVGVIDFCEAAVKAIQEHETDPSKHVPPNPIQKKQLLRAVLGS